MTAGAPRGRPPSPLPPAARAALAAQLAHDIGKYVARGACNVRAGEPLPAALLALIARDLYELPGGRRASARFAELAAPLRAGPPQPALERCAGLLAAIDALEPAVRAGEEPALRRAAALALQVQALLDAFAQAQAERAP